MRSFRALVLRFDVIAGSSPPPHLSPLGMGVSIHTLELEIAFLDHPKRSRCNAFDLIEMRVVCRDKNNRKTHQIVNDGN
jgi:hypothetical protein